MSREDKTVQSWLIPRRIVESMWRLGPRGLFAQISLHAIKRDCAEWEGNYTCQDSADAPLH